MNTKKSDQFHGGTEEVRSFMGLLLLYVHMYSENYNIKFAMKFN